ncbi:lipase family protein [Actinomadura flavalba]|uniref:lipase family protein n=1 Tax=Actinomadura flavalba TaxID=1120938 RepID=UPI000475C361|nr:lipase family protein [Actinomadura flavalba]
MRVRTLLTAAVIAAASMLPAAQPASAAPPPGCTLKDAEIYAPAPKVVTGENGDLVGCTEVRLTTAPIDVAYKAWKIRYVSTDVKGRKILVSGFVAVPDAPWTKGGSRPVVANSAFTHGSGSQCSISKQLSGNFNDGYDGPIIAGFLKQGWAVAASDGVGYLDGETHSYVNGPNAAHSVLDSVRAAYRLPGKPVAPGGKVGLTGYSEGGAGSLWAAQEAKSYAPELNVVGVASGGVPGDLKVTAEMMSGGFFAGFMAIAVIGLHVSYPEMPFAELLNDFGKKAVKDVVSHCMFGTLAIFAGKKIEDFTTKKLTLPQIYALKGPDGTTWGEILDRHKLGVGIGRAGSGARYEIGFPVFQYRGWFEEAIPHETTDETRALYCKAGIPTSWKNGYPTEHATTYFGAAGDVLKFLDDRFTGRPFTGNC